MTPKRSVNAGALPAFEPLEARLLLSADALTGEAALAPPDGTVVAAELEAESNGGPSNDDLASAQELSFSYVVPWVNPDDGFGPQQAAVFGTADGSGGGEAYDRSFLLFHVIDGDYPPFGLDFPDATTPGGDGLLTISAYADLEGTDKYLTLEGTLGEEKILLGHLFVTDVPTGGVFTTEVVIPAEELALLAADGVISLTFTASAAVESNGTNYISAHLVYGGGGGGTGDYYRFDLAEGESVSLAMTGSADLALYDAAGQEVAAGAAISDFYAEQGGTYYAGVTGSGDYYLTVTRNATLDREPNSTLAGAQIVGSAVLQNRQWVLGTASGDSDFYALSMTAGGMLKLRAYAPLAPGGVNDLQPIVRVYDSAGNLVAGGEGATASYRVPSGGDGTYYVELIGADGTEGPYALSLQYQPGKAKAPKAPKGGQKAPKTPPGLALGQAMRGKMTGLKGGAWRGLDLLSIL